MSYILEQYYNTAFWRNWLKDLCRQADLQQLWGPMFHGCWAQNCGTAFQLVLGKRTSAANSLIGGAKDLFVSALNCDSRNFRTSLLTYLRYNYCSYNKHAALLLPLWLYNSIGYIQYS